ncbi:hypothetical protein A3H90_02850 [Candidatus Peribacteria bacterium RIFCSPLOWO2_02_FULL_55_36]|nr:MAG: hypothetical protein A3D12_03950 [Candidatus Peribacteria bacterium RIFCSPHIGHO2_02_FULL_55_24]OGJ65148.1 MAG: hypothetical protein A3E47_03325 [Candidatus Peribacteria bacterium RIFCSPHIGHO2_12_FULL_54_10]OGJ69561.1 MAG: hypothetical protein A3H90_02850 [Candidatus Peribacteria bacterium RIFCSPLOWO2_02_FULL_55_36]
MPPLEITHRFLKDVKRWKRSGRGLEPLEELFCRIEKGMWPPAVQYEAHLLSGDLEGVWDIHLRQNWIVLVKFHEGTVWALRMGTHAELGL